MATEDKQEHKNFREEGKPVPIEVLSEEEQAVRDWRVEVIEKLGYSKDDANLMAASMLDLGELRELLKAGATHEQARRILT